MAWSSAAWKARPRKRSCARSWRARPAARRRGADGPGRGADAHRDPRPPDRGHRAARRDGAAARPGLRPLVELVAAGHAPVHLDRPGALAALPQPRAAPDQRRALPVAAAAGRPGVPPYLRLRDPGPGRVPLAAALVRPER